MKKNIELLMAKQFAELAQLNLSEMMKDDSLSDKEFNAIREAHDSIASAYDTIKRLTKPQRMVSAEVKENGYSEPEELTEFEQRIMRLVNRSTFQRRTVDEDGARYVAGLLLPYAKKQLEKQGQKIAWSEEDMSKVQRICKYLNEAKKYYADITEVRECMDWLKYIENRIKGE